MSKSEIGDDGVTAGETKVLGCDVAVKNVAVVGVREPDDLARLHEELA